MKPYFLSLLLLISGPLLAQTSIYRSVDAEGNPVFSDEPMPESEQIDLHDIQTVPAEKGAKFKYTPREKAKEDKYESLTVITPADDTSVRENAGNLAVVIESNPALLPGHRAVIYLDGVEVAGGAQTSFTLDNLERGTHSVSASIFAGDKVLIVSPAVTFTLHRHSIQHPQPAPPPPPPKK